MGGLAQLVLLNEKFRLEDTWFSYIYCLNNGGKTTHHDVESLLLFEWQFRLLKDRVKKLEYIKLERQNLRKVFVLEPDKIVSILPLEILWMIFKYLDSSLEYDQTELEKYPFRHYDNKKDFLYIDLIT